MQNPSPGQAPNRQQSAPSDQRATYDSPTIVELKGSDDAHQKAERQRKTDEENFAAATEYLAGFALLLAAVAGLQIWVFLRQLRLMRACVEDAKTAAEAARDAAYAAQLSADAQRNMAATMARPRMSEMLLSGV